MQCITRNLIKKLDASVVKVQRLSITITFSSVVFNHNTSAVRATVWLIVLTVFHIDEWATYSLPYSCKNPFTEIYKHWIFVNRHNSMMIMILVWNRVKTFCFADVSTFFTWRSHGNTVFTGKYASHTIRFSAANCPNFTLKKLRFNRIFRT